MAAIEPVIVRNDFQKSRGGSYPAEPPGEEANSLPAKEIGVFGDRLAALQHDPTVKVIVITGTGEAFTSGQDVNDINTMQGAELAALFERDIDILTRIVRCRRSSSSR